MKVRYLTKSRFKLGMECPTKLYYTGKEEYVNNSLEDPFLLALAEGGFQVGELAKCYFPGGHDIETLDYDKALKQTNELLKQDKVIIYEAAIKFDNFFIRTDILVKNGNHIRIIEVKAKSTSEPTDDVFVGKKGGLLNKWRPYVNDIAFQKYVASKAFPDYDISSYLMLVNKAEKCQVEGLNQKFKISRDGSGRRYVIVSEDISKEDLSSELLAQINTDAVCEIIYNTQYNLLGRSLSFVELINDLANKYRDDVIIGPQLTGACRKCEFKASKEEIEAGFKSGYHQCFAKALNWKDKDFEEGNIFDIWNSRRTDKYISDGKIKLSQINMDDIGPRSDSKPGISPSERRWLQIEKAKNKDKSYWLDRMNLEKEMQGWTYPLHFIDFETSMPAIPFNRGRRPYEGIAFQFSHHIVDADGRVEHKGEYLNTKPGVFPNYEFIRRLKDELDIDKGTIFRYSHHENTYLNIIYSQLQADESNIKDRKELCEFIREITEYDDREKASGRIYGPRNMVDMLDLVKRYYYDPYMKGSNSIKVVLPAILNSSDFLQEKYSKPIYGSDDGIVSLNFKDWTWVKFEDGEVVDPYKLLPKMFDDISEKDNEVIALEGGISDGGAAMTAYARLQFENLSDDLRIAIEKSLLKYCELDTLAMVMIYEGLKDLMSK